MLLNELITLTNLETLNLIGLLFGLLIVTSILVRDSCRCRESREDREELSNLNGLVLSGLCGAFLLFYNFYIIINNLCFFYKKNYLKYCLFKRS